MTGEISEILARFNDLEIVILRIAGLSGIILLCLSVLRGHYQVLFRKSHRRRTKERKN
jgi:hypothetical protein